MDFNPSQSTANAAMLAVGGVVLGTMLWAYSEPRKRRKRKARFRKGRRSR